MDTNKKKTLSLVFLCLSIIICLLQSPVIASDFRVENGVLTNYSGAGGNIKIPAGVTAIGGSVFKGNSSITSVAFPDSITVIKAQAFMNCTSLKSSTSYKSNDNGFVIDNGELLSYTGSDTNVTIPNGVTSVASTAFMNKNVSNVNVPDSVTNIADNAIPASASITATADSYAAKWAKNTGHTLIVVTPLATKVSILNTAGADITGQTVTTTAPNYQLKAAATPATAVQSFTWKSSNATIATVDANGYVTFLRAGTATFTAVTTDASGKYGSVAVTYNTPVPLVTSIVIKDGSGKDVTGQTVSVTSATYQLKASASPASASQKLNWVSSDVSVATVDASGKVTFLKGGSVMIIAAATDGSGVSVSVTLTTDIKATKVVIKNSSGTNITGKTTKVTKKTYQLKAAVEPETYASQKVNWKSSNTKVATVNANGKVTFKKAGKVKITATAADGSGVSASVTLKTNIKATKVTIRNTKGKAISHKTLKIKTKTVQVKAVAIPKKFAKQKFTWKTSDKNIATVKAGKVTFKKAGTVKITATAKDGSKKSNWVKITYKPSSGKSVDPGINETPVVVLESGSEWPELIVIEEPEPKGITLPEFENK